MMNRWRFCILVFCALTGSIPAFAVENYVYFDLERGRIKDEIFLKTPELVGAQLKYTWKELEPRKDQYDFSSIQSDLDFLKAKGKKLFVQIQDVSFAMKNKHVPEYLVTEPEYHGGVAIHYVGEGQNAKPEGWIARRWDPNVAARFYKLLLELGKQFDGKIAGLNLPETAFAYGDREDLLPNGFTYGGYRDSVIENLKVLKKAFAKTIAIQYANFMPGEWLPEDNKNFLGSIYAVAAEIGVGIGGPDLLPYKPGQMKHAYRFIPQYAEKAPVGMAIQWNNYKHVNPRTGKEVTVDEIYRFGVDYLKSDYLFWCTQEPYYTQKVIPFLKEVSAK